MEPKFVSRPPVDTGRAGRIGRPYSQHTRNLVTMLRARPGDWALIEESVSTDSKLRTRINSGQGMFAPAGSFQAVRRKLYDDAGVYRCHATYARYVGADGEYATDTSTDDTDTDETDNTDAQNGAVTSVQVSAEDLFSQA